MTPLAIGMPGLPELIIILVVVLLLFGGTRLAGLGKSTGRAIKEFKDETKGLRDKQGNKIDDNVAEGEVVGEPTTPDVEPKPGTTEQQTPNQPTAADPRRDS